MPLVIDLSGIFADPGTGQKQMGGLVQWLPMHKENEAAPPCDKAAFYGGDGEKNKKHDSNSRLS